MYSIWGWLRSYNVPPSTVGVCRVWADGSAQPTSCHPCPFPLPPQIELVSFCRIFLWLPYANIFRTGPPVFANLPLGVTLITNRSV